MPCLLSHRRLFSRSLAALALFALGAGLSGCAQMGDTISPAFADPAKYDLYDCKQLETERKALAARAAELQGLMTKAETGVAGSVVAEVAYRNDYIAVRGQSKLAEEAWQKNRCQESEAGSQCRRQRRRRSRRLRLPRVAGRRPAGGELGGEPAER